VDGGHGGVLLVPARGVGAAGVAEERRAPRLVQRRPVADAVTERLGDDVGVVEALSDRVADGYPLISKLRCRFE